MLHRLVSIRKKNCNHAPRSFLCTDLQMITNLWHGCDIMDALTSHSWNIRPQKSYPISTCQRSHLFHHLQMHMATRTKISDSPHQQIQAYLDLRINTNISLTDIVGWAQSTSTSRHSSQDESTDGNIGMCMLTVLLWQDCFSNHTDVRDVVILSHMFQHIPALFFASCHSESTVNSSIPELILICKQLLICVVVGHAWI